MLSQHYSIISRFLHEYYRPLTLQYSVNLIKLRNILLIKIDRILTKLTKKKSETTMNTLKKDNNILESFLQHHSKMNTIDYEMLSKFE